MWHAMHPFSGMVAYGLDHLVWRCLWGQWQNVVIDNLSMSLCVLVTIGCNNTIPITNKSKTLNFFKCSHTQLPFQSSAGKQQKQKKTMLIFSDSEVKWKTHSLVEMHIILVHLAYVSLKMNIPHTYMIFSEYLDMFHFS